jgi:hypothetical protein
MSRRYATLSSPIPAIGRGQESLHAIFSGNPNICSGCGIRCYAGRRPLRRPRRATAHRESIRPTWSPASSDQRQHDHPAGVHGRPGTQWHRLGGSLKIVDGTEPRLAATRKRWSGPPAEVPSDPRPRRRRGTCGSCSALGPPRRARPRLVRVRLADNLRGAPGGPADPNGTLGSPPPATDGSTDHRQADAGSARKAREPLALAVSRLPFLPSESHSCEWAELPRELSTVSHSGQVDA